MQQQQKSIDMSKLIAAINRRINPSGVLELTVRQYGAEQIEVIIPEVDPRQIDQIKKKDQHQRSLGVPHRRQSGRPTNTLSHWPSKPTGAKSSTAGRVAARWVKLGRQEAIRAGHVTRESPTRGTEVLVLIDQFNVTGGYLTLGIVGTG